jgi:hypothetical protein
VWNHCCIDSLFSLGVSVTRGVSENYQRQERKVKE